MSGFNCFEIVPLPGGRGDIRKHFGFQIDSNDTVLNKKQVYCRECKSIIAYSGNATNLKSHFSNGAAHQKTSCSSSDIQNYLGFVVKSLLKVRWHLSLNIQSQLVS
ncbi:Zinc finger C2H2-type,Zinc finger, BED-type [Cinara cedri]|uniref:Zinc finger C2H2-type,Zinc finger, BED-type n=1 Tax=Cinara cedri TaxID=506608 RepID=A0A5E4MXG9_9HEMI|nr:Zinc finger C2H2-type,Zinc finger, BED-type [Cinara cedri]